MVCHYVFAIIIQKTLHPLKHVLCDCNICDKLTEAFGPNIIFFKLRNKIFFMMSVTENVEKPGDNK